MSSYQDMVGELIGSVPGLPQPAAERMVNIAWEDVRKERLWSWQVQVGEVYSPALVTSGLVAVEQFSDSVQFDATAIAVLDALALAEFPPLVPRQFRINTSGSPTSGSSPIYTLTGYTSGTGVGTLDRVYAEATNATASYSLYKSIYTPPFTDFLSYVSINNPVSGYSIFGKALRGDAAELNRMDPMRGSLGVPWRLFSSTPDSTGLVQHEWWPGPQNAQAFLCTCVRSGMDMLTAGEELPITIATDLVVERGLYHAYRWALAHSGSMPELKGVPWLAMMQEIAARYRVDLVKAKRNDNEILLTNHFDWTSQISKGLGWGPIDSNWSQSHDVYGF